MSAILENTISRDVARGVAVPGFLLTAKSGKRYFITADGGNIVRLDMAFEPSGKWRAVAVYTSRGAYLSDWSTFASAYAGTDKPMAHKNGAPLYCLGDFDHGSRRSWGDGIASIRRATFSRHADGFWRAA